MEAHGIMFYDTKLTRKIRAAMNGKEVGVSAKTATKKSLGGRPTRARVIAIREGVVAATFAAFEQSGTNFSVEQVALAAGVSKQAIYRRWSSKIDLMIEATDFAVRNNTAGQYLPADPVAALREMCWRWFGDDMAALQGMYSFLQSQAILDARIRAQIIEWRDRL